MIKSHSRRMLASAATVLGVLTLTAAKVEGRVADCERASDWVKMNLGTLPTSLLEYSKFSPTYRAAIYSALKPAERKELWLEHHAKFLRQESVLSTEQRLFLRDVDAIIERVLREDAASDSIQALAIAVLGKDLARDVFVSLGGAGAKSGFAAAKSALGFAVAQCECNQDDNWCIFFGCFAFDCEETETGCGWLNRKPCNGTCGLSQNDD